MKAKYIAHWPGKDTPVCDVHKEKMNGIAMMMGMPITCTKLPDDSDLLCTNCVNESKKRDAE
jgi:hypothetical protein